ncbi:MAG: glycosyltransferase family 4 protein [Cyanobacteria bacterium J06600_6]
MKYHIILTKVHARRFYEASSATLELPRFDLSLLAKSLNATLITPASYPIKLIDRIGANLAGTPENWAYAREIASQLTSDDVIFCPGEEIGIPLASICRGKPNRPKIVVWFHRITGLQAKAALKLLKIEDAIDLAVVSSTANQRFLQNYLNLASEKILLWWNPIDVSYFSSKTFSVNNPRPLIVSSGLERRDYKLLAAATENLNLDVKVAGFSQFQSRVARNFPKVMPKNMSNRRYHLSELVKLYHRADLVVLCLRENDGTCGVTVLSEAMACGKAVVCTRTKGLSDYLDNQDAIITVKPGDVTDLREALQSLLNNPAEAKLRGQRAYKLVKERCDVESQIDVLAKFMKTLEAVPRVSVSSF